MSYKTAAFCLMALTITLFFTTSKADFDIVRAKDSMRKLLNGFTRKILETRVKDLDGLIDIAEALVMGQMMGMYVGDVAKDPKTCAIVLTHIDTYKTTFVKLLENIKEEVPEERKLPMYVTLNNINLICDATLKKLENTARSELVSSTASLSLRDHFLDSDGVDVNKVDKYGFKISEGILEVRKMMDILLQLAMNKQCEDLETLKKFGKEMLPETTAYWKELFKIAPEAPAIQGYINEYSIGFDQILNDAKIIVHGSNIPMADRLNILTNHSTPPGKVPVLIAL